MSRRQYTKHMLTHADVRPTCGYCKKSFATKDGLRVHHKKHCSLARAIIAHADQTEANLVNALEVPVSGTDSVVVESKDIIAGPSKVQSESSGHVSQKIGSVAVLPDVGVEAIASTSAAAALASSEVVFKCVVCSFVGANLPELILHQIGHCSRSEVELIGAEEDKVLENLLSLHAVHEAMERVNAGGRKRKSKLVRNSESD